MGSQPEAIKSIAAISPAENKHEAAIAGLSEHQLKVVSQSWTQEQWETYLASTETPLYESLISESEFHKLIEDQTESVFEFAQQPCSPESSSRVWRAMRELTPRQREIIHLIFWREKSERDVASLLGISRPSVQVLKRRALQKMKQLLSSIFHM